LICEQDLFFIEPQRHRGHRGREEEILCLWYAIGKYFIEDFYDD